MWPDSFERMVYRSKIPQKTAYIRLLFKIQYPGDDGIGKRFIHQRRRQAFKLINAFFISDYILLKYVRPAASVSPWPAIFADSHDSTPDRSVMSPLPLDS
jgi:hypothetical protein